MKSLPVPPLEQTLAAYLATVAVLQDADEQARTRAAVRAFSDGAGPACQAELERFAAAQDRAGTSWLWDAWLAGYHGTRAPLPLVSNVGFEIAMPAGAPGPRRAARIVRGFVAASLAQLRGEAPGEVSPRGEALSMLQWLPIRGGIRDPRPGQDVFLPGPPEPGDREIIVLVRGRAYAVGVSDGAGRPISLAAMDRQLSAAVAAAHEAGPVAVPFAAPAYADADAAARFLADLTARPGNAATYDRLRRVLYVVTLIEEADEATEPVAHLERLTYAAGEAWPFKPITLQISLAETFAGIHLEHSMLDGATVGAIIRRAQEAIGRDEDATRAASAAGPATAPASLAWDLTAGEQGDLAAALTAYGEQARHHRFRIVRAPLRTPPALAFRLSHDAGCQLVLAYAQLRTYGRLRSTYESVDMREYEGGRTECLRPNTPAMAACARAMVDGTATPDHLVAALAAHRAAVKRCKAGQGIDRHLWGLDLMARRLGLPNPLTADVGYRLLVTDFLSTTSLGDQATIVRAAFAPTSPGGIGVYYVPLPAEGLDEFCLNWDDRDRDDIGSFEAAIREGTAALEALLARCAAEPPTEPTHAVTDRAAT